MLSDRQFIQYSRQIMLPEVGESGVERLQKSSVTIIGAGGLGSTIAHQLAAAGVGQLIVVDDDKVELSNLPRQFIYSQEDINRPKVKCLENYLYQKYTDSKIKTINQRLTADNYQSHLAQLKSDIILDCSDNFITRKLVNQISLNLPVPLISASVSQFESQIISISPNTNPATGCYQCIIPDDIDENQNCSAMGVMGSVVAIVASMQAWLAQQYLLNLNFPVGTLLRFDALTNQWIKAKINRNNNCKYCSV